MTLRMVASVRNCISTFCRVAPMALRMPISRVRSVTETNMMFMMPMPPTSSEMPATPPRKRVSTPVIAVADSSISSWLRMVKSSS